MKYTFKLSGVECSACIKLAKKDFEKIPKIERLQLNEDGVGSFETNEQTDKDQINNKYLKNNYYIEELNES